MKAVVGDKGVAVYNVCARKPALFALFRKQFANVFAEVHSIQTEDVNQMFLLTERSVVKGEDVDKSRTEETKKLLSDFRFPPSFCRVLLTNTPSLIGVSF